MNNYLPIINMIITKYDINIDSSKKAAIYRILSKYIDILIFNVVTILSIITMINNSTTIHKDALKLLKSYINETCHKTKLTGGSLPSEYFGINSGIYNENNATGNILDIDFSSDTLRPQIGGGSVASYKMRKEDINALAGHIKNIVSYYKLKISNDIIVELVNLINDNINCLFRQLKNIKIINPSIIKKMINSNKTLEIFK
jgi:hypothetical protein